jgi:hypothetical protein
VIIHDKSHRQSVRSHLEYFARRIHTPPLWYSEKRPIGNRQLAITQPSTYDVVQVRDDSSKTVGYEAFVSRFSSTAP